MSENGILANIFRMGDQVKRNLRDFAGNPGDYLDNVAHQNNIEWKKDPIERSMGFFNPVPLGKVDPFLLRKQMKEAIKEITSKPKIPPLPQEVFEQAYRDFPEVPRELMERHLKQAYKTGVAEKTSDPNTWSAAQRTMYDNGDWKGFSKSRGYSDVEIADFNEMLSLHKQMGEYLPDKKGPNGEVWDDLGSIDAFLVNPYVEKTKQLLSSFEKNPIQSQSRRDFMKKSGGIAAGTAAASIPGAKLLQKFAPEERTLAKEANVAKQTAVEAAPKYKYNSLKEYLDDAKMWAKEDFKAADLSGQGARYSKDEFLKRQLLADEAKYNAASKNGKQKWTTDESTGIPRTRNSYTTIKAEDGTEHIYDTVSGRILNPVEDHLNSFSPQAKKEMKEFKELSGKTYGQPERWPEYLMDHFSP